LTPNSELRAPNFLSLIATLASAGSTNDICAGLIPLYADVPEKLPTALMFADAQTAGKGRGDHAWISPPGGLYFSILFSAEPVPPFLPLTTGLFLARWLKDDFGLDVKVRWPNDLMLDGKKLGGILCEGKGGACIIGVGINVNASIPTADKMPQPAVALSEAMGYDLDLRDLRRRVEGLTADLFFPFILDSRNLSGWDSRSAFARGQAIAWTSGGRPGHGTYLGITPEGYLKVNSGGAIFELSSAENAHPA
jgi:BirA family transcriptional regulator, biotin operon repressor / biotin---[acetyl-CoA-carboxylase] ligase